MANEATANTVYHFRLRGTVRRDIARLNLSQNELARKLGLTSGFMSQLLNGKRFAGPETRRKIMDTLPGLAFDEVFEEVGVRDD
jgi:transcriptional regulator with XRE-family HTH domain